MKAKIILCFLSLLLIPSIAFAVCCQCLSDCSGSVNEYTCEISWGCAYLPELDCYGGISCIIPSTSTTSSTTSTSSITTTTASLDPICCDLPSEGFCERITQSACTGQGGYPHPGYKCCSTGGMNSECMNVLVCPTTSSTTTSSTTSSTTTTTIASKGCCAFPDGTCGDDYTYPQCYEGSWTSGTQCCPDGTCQIPPCVTTGCCEFTDGTCGDGYTYLQCNYQGYWTQGTQCCPDGTCQYFPCVTTSSTTTSTTTTIDTTCGTGAGELCDGFNRAFCAPASYTPPNLECAGVCRYHFYPTGNTENNECTYPTPQCVCNKETACDPCIEGLTCISTGCVSCNNNPPTCEIELDCSNNYQCDCDSECASGHCCYSDTYGDMRCSADECDEISCTDELHHTDCPGCMACVNEVCVENIAKSLGKICNDCGNDADGNPIAACACWQGQCVPWYCDTACGEPTGECKIVVYPDFSCDSTYYGFDYQFSTPVYECITGLGQYAQPGSVCCCNSGTEEPECYDDNDCLDPSKPNCCPNHVCHECCTHDDCINNPDGSYCKAETLTCGCTNPLYHCQEPAQICPYNIAEKCSPVTYTCECGSCTYGADNAECDPAFPCCTGVPTPSGPGDESGIQYKCVEKGRLSAYLEWLCDPGTWYECNEENLDRIQAWDTYKYKCVYEDGYKWIDISNEIDWTSILNNIVQKIIISITGLKLF